MGDIPSGADRSSHARPAVAVKVGSWPPA